MMSYGSKSTLQTAFVLTLLACAFLILPPEFISACSNVGGSWKDNSGDWGTVEGKKKILLQVNSSGYVNLLDISPFSCGSFSSEEAYGYPMAILNESGHFAATFELHHKEGPGTMRATISGDLSKDNDSGAFEVCLTNDPCCKEFSVKSKTVVGAIAQHAATLWAVDVRISGGAREDVDCRNHYTEAGVTTDRREYWGSTTVAVRATCKEGREFNHWEVSHFPEDVPQEVVDSLVESFYANPARVGARGGVMMDLLAWCSKPGLDLSTGPFNPKGELAQTQVPGKTRDKIMNHIKLEARSQDLMLKNLEYALVGNGNTKGIGGGLKGGVTLYRDLRCSGDLGSAIGVPKVSGKRIIFTELDEVLEPGLPQCYVLGFRFNKQAFGDYGAVLAKEDVVALDENMERRIPASGNNVKGTMVINLDTDSDGILDYFETYGYDYYGDGSVFVDLPGMGANVNHKDIFVEIDWMADAKHHQKPDAVAMQDVVRAFKDAPVDNPDGVNGITLHLDTGEWGGGNAVPFDKNLSPVWDEFDAIKATNFDPARSVFFHYCLFAYHHSGATSSGMSRGIPASDFIVSLGSFRNGVGTQKQQSGTFMHELGHNLGLKHGGVDHVNYKPNHLSIMNYFFQLDWLRYNRSDSKLDYSIFDIKDLKEKKLDEQKGLDNVGGDSPLSDYGTRFFDTKHTAVVNNTCCWRLDWNGNDEWDEDPVEVDLNNDGKENTLKGHCNEWQVLNFKGGDIGAGIKLKQEVAAEDMEEELTFEEYRRMKALTQEVDGKILLPD